MNDYQVFFFAISYSTGCGKYREVESTELKNSDFMHDTWKEIFFFFNEFSM